MDLEPRTRCYRIAMLLSNAYATWLCWAGIAIGCAVVASALLSMHDIQRKVLDAIVWSVTSSAFVIWLGVMACCCGVAAAAEAQRATRR